ncbi:DsbA family protein [Spiractinospora alimapuensis]|uniref:DsbA family protein n=1 Tax=Spiractinospora alimapuensis TaxID=2820884 RepID=UPI001F472D89|nr:DsbA family protein [Spiractinospora alimapuensis]QVQ52904.1 DsbA family protein [Spiractinospora alimapuensis]
MSLAPPHRSGAALTVTEYTDPGCVVSWASEPRLRYLRLRYSALVHWRQVIGLQIADATRTDPGFTPEGAAPGYLRRWREVADRTGTPITERLRWMHHSTAPAGRAAIAARAQGPGVAARVLRRLRELVFLHGTPVDSVERARNSLGVVPGLDLPRLLRDMESERVHETLRAEAAETRRVHPDTEIAARTGEPTPHPGTPVPDGGTHRYGFPTLVFQDHEHTLVVPGFRQVREYEAALEHLLPGVTARAAPLPSVTALLAETGTLTAPEVSLLAGGELPPQAQRLDGTTGEVWVRVAPSQHGPPADADSRRGTAPTA